VSLVEMFGADKLIGEYCVVISSYKIRFLWP